MLLSKKEKDSGKNTELNFDKNHNDFEFVSDVIKNSHNLRNYLLHFTANIEAYVTFIEKTMRLKHSAYIFILNLAGVWYDFFGRKPTLNHEEANIEVVQTKISLQFDPFVARIIPGGIPYEIIRSALQDWRPPRRAPLWTKKALV